MLGLPTDVSMALLLWLFCTALLIISYFIGKDQHYVDSPEEEWRYKKLFILGGSITSGSKSPFFAYLVVTLIVLGMLFKHFTE